MEEAKSEYQLLTELLQVFSHTVMVREVRELVERNDDKRVRTIGFGFRVFGSGCTRDGDGDRIGGGSRKALGKGHHALRLSVSVRVGEERKTTE